MSETMIYEIGGRRFEQRRLVWGQILQVRQLFTELRGEFAGGAGDLIDVLGPRVPRFAAIVLREASKPLAGKDLEEVAAHIEEHLDAVTGVKVVTDFLSCNPIASDLNALADLTAAIRERLPKATTESSGSSASSPVETSPGETPSCGDTPPESVNPSFDIGNGS